MSNIKEIPVDIVEKIRNGDNKSLNLVYGQVYPMVEKYIIENSGSKDDAKDVFQDAMFIFMKKIEQTNFELSSKLSTFIYGISKNLWLKKLTKKKVDNAELKSEFEFDLLEDDLTFKLEKLKIVKLCIERLGEPCQTIIIQFYYFKQTMKEIAEKLHYSNAENAKNQKYKCLIRLKKMINKDFDK